MRIIAKHRFLNVSNFCTGSLLLFNANSIERQMAQSKTKRNFQFSALISFCLVCLFMATLSISSADESNILLANSSASPSISNIDIDGNEQFDALTDGLLLLRSMFGLSGSSLIAGAIADDALYIQAEEI